MRDSEHVCLEFANRYFRGKDDDVSTVLSLGSDIDPYGILQSRCSDGEHTEDNVVLYFERKVDATSGYVFLVHILHLSAHES